MTLIEELQQNYYTVKEAVSKMHFETPRDYEAFLAAGFRTAWGSAWSKAGRDARAASTPPSNGSAGNAGASELQTCTAPTASYTLPTALLGSGQNEKLSEAPASAEAGSGAARFLAVLLRTRALTDSQYKALCKELAIQYPARPVEQDVMSLGHDAVVRVLCGGRS